MLDFACANAKGVCEHRCSSRMYLSTHILKLLLQSLCKRRDIGFHVCALLLGRRKRFSGLLHLSRSSLREKADGVGIG